MFSNSLHTLTYFNLSLVTQNDVPVIVDLLLFVTCYCIWDVRFHCLFSWESFMNQNLRNFCASADVAVRFVKKSFIFQTVSWLIVQTYHAGDIFFACIASTSCGWADSAVSPQFDPAFLSKHAWYCTSRPCRYCVNVSSDSPFLSDLLKVNFLSFTRCKLCFIHNSNFSLIFIL